MKIEDWNRLHNRLILETEELYREYDQLKVEAKKVNSATKKTIKHLEDVINCIEEAIESIYYFIEYQEEIKNEKNDL